MFVSVYMSVNEYFTSENMTKRYRLILQKSWQHHVAMTKTIKTTIKTAKAPTTSITIKARQGKARQGKARQGKARQGKARQDKAK